MIFIDIDYYCVFDDIDGCGIIECEIFGCGCIF